MPNDIRSQVEYGLDTIDPDRRVEVSLRDLMYVHETLAELNRFFHQPLHYPDLESVERFMGDRDQGGYAVLHEALYSRMRRMVPADLDESFAEGVFSNPEFPDYCEASE